MNFSKRLFVSTSCFNINSLTNQIIEAKKIGIKNLELSINISKQHYYNFNSIKTEKMKFLLHNYSPPPRKDFVLNLSSRDKKNLEKSINFCKKSIRLTHKLGGKFYSIHSGFSADVEPKHLGAKIPKSKVFDPKIGMEIFFKSIERLLKYAQSFNILILIENHLVSLKNIKEQSDNALILSNPKDLLDFVSYFKNKNLGILLDTSHAEITSKNLSFSKNLYFEYLGSNIKALHVSRSKNNLDLNLPIKKNFWFKKYLNKNLTYILEYNYINKKIYNESCNLLFS